MRKQSKFSYSRIYYPTPKKKEGFYISAKSLKFVCVFLILGGIAYFLFFSSFFSLKNVIVEGEIDDTLKTDIMKLKDKNIFSISQEDLEKNIKAEHPMLKTVKVLKGFPDSLKVSAEKRNQSLIWLTQGKYFAVDNTGLAYEGLSSLSPDNKEIIVEDRKNVPVEAGQKIVVPEFINFVKKSLELISSKTGIKLTGLAVEESTYHVFIKTEAGWQIILDVSRPAEKQIDDLNLILTKCKDQVHEYVDLRIEGRAYYK